MGEHGPTPRDDINGVGQSGQSVISRAAIHHIVPSVSSQVYMTDVTELY